MDINAQARSRLPRRSAPTSAAARCAHRTRRAGGARGFPRFCGAPAHAHHAAARPHADLALARACAMRLPAAVDPRRRSRARDSAGLHRRARALSWPTSRAAHADVRLAVRRLGSGERGRRARRRPSDVCVRWGALARPSEVLPPRMGAPLSLVCHVYQYYSYKRKDTLIPGRSASDERATAPRVPRTGHARAPLREAATAPTRVLTARGGLPTTSRGHAAAAARGQPAAAAPPPRARRRERSSVTSTPRSTFTIETSPAACTATRCRTARGGGLEHLPDDAGAAVQTGRANTAA